MIFPCMPRGSLSLVTLSSSSVPMIPIHSCIKKITEKQIDKKVRKGLGSKYDVLNESV